VRIGVTGRGGFSEDEVEIAAAVDGKNRKYATIGCSGRSCVSSCDRPGSSTIGRAGELDRVQRAIWDVSRVKISVVLIDNQIARDVDLIERLQRGDLHQRRKCFSAVGRFGHE